jgi:hypothetical protein
MLNFFITHWKSRGYEKYFQKMPNKKWRSLFLQTKSTQKHVLPFFYLAFLLQKKRVVFATDRENTLKSAEGFSNFEMSRNIGGHKDNAFFQYALLFYKKKNFFLQSSF